MNLLTKQKQTHRPWERIYGCWGKRWEEGIIRKFGMDMNTLLYLKWITNKNLLYSTGNSAQCYVAAWMGGEFGGEWIHVYVWLSPFDVHMRLSQCCLLIDYVLVGSPSHIQLFATPWTAAHQVSLSLTTSWSLLKFRSTESVKPSNHLLHCPPLLLLPNWLCMCAC